MRTRTKTEGFQQQSRIRLMNVLHAYSYERGGDHYLHVPKPGRDIDEKVTNELEQLKSLAVRGKCCVISADEISRAFAHSHPHLFEPATVCFEIYTFSNPCLQRFFWRR